MTPATRPIWTRPSSPGTVSRPPGPEARSRSPYDLGNPAGRTDGSRMTFGAPVTRTAVLTYDKNAAGRGRIRPVGHNAGHDPDGLVQDGRQGVRPRAAHHHA